MNELEVTHNAEDGRFEIDLDGERAVLTVAEEPGRIALLHTEVPPGYRRRGIGSRLVEAALQHARDEALTVQPFCGFVKVYLERHPEFRDLVL